MFDFIDHKEQINLLYGFFFASLQDDALVSKNWIALCIDQWYMLVYRHTIYASKYQSTFLTYFKMYETEKCNE